MDAHLSAEGHLVWKTRSFRCAIGRGGLSIAKREGDGATPVGRHPFRRLLYRPDRLARPTTRLPVDRIDRADGWCDAPTDARYNQQVRLPYPASHERLWRDDHLYDVVVVLGYNDAPIIAGRGSAIFLHVARDDYGPTEGCLALALPDLLTLLAEAGPEDGVVVPAPGADALTRGSAARSRG
ncbi:MAG TPA: L,D-transpeptidase family protein [Alphaproteobacteria bacterium]|nr:L,D-transpeptidase family protein [Alphaproteobacteria bacterium]